MYITKKIDRRQLVKLLNGMFFYVVNITFDTDSNDIKIWDDKTEVRLKVIQ